MPAKPLVLLGVAILIAIPAIAQQAAQTPQPAQPATNTVTAQPTPSPVTRPAPATGPSESGVEVVSAEALPKPPPPVEYPAWAHRDPWEVGLIDPQAGGLGAQPWGNSSGAFLSTMMRRMQTPIASRWGAIALRNALIARTRAPRDVHPVDWAAERAWLLLRLGEADAARMLVASIDTDRFTPKMTQVAVQAALATADPPALCGYEQLIRRHERPVSQLVSAMCASLAGEPESASAQIDNARRFGRIGGIDLVLAEKVVGAGSNSRSVTVEWEPVEHLSAWRFGLATATGMVPPERLIRDASPQLRAFQARAPLLSPADRIQSALIAAGLGVFSSQSMIDLYSAIYETTDPSDLPSSDAYQLRQAFVAADMDDRVAAIRRILDLGKDGLAKEGARAAAARAASLITPDSKYQDDAPDLIAAMLAGGYDRAAARWADVVGEMDNEQADRCWAMLALASPNAVSLGIAGTRVSSFIRRDDSPDKRRSGLLVAALAGLGRISTSTANGYSRSNNFGLGLETSWTRMISGAARRGQSGTAVVLAASGLQGIDPDRIPPAHLYRALAALKATGQDYTARMIAAEALART
jgi:hypothetical protein